MEALGAGEILLNCIDEDGQGNGFDLALVKQARITNAFSACVLPLQLPSCSRPAGCSTICSSFVCWLPSLQPACAKPPGAPGALRECMG